MPVLVVYRMCVTGRLKLSLRLTASASGSTRGGAGFTGSFTFGTSSFAILVVVCTVVTVLPPGDKTTGSHCNGPCSVSVND